MAKKTIWSIQDRCGKNSWFPWHYEYDTEESAVRSMEYFQTRYKSKRFRVIKRVITSESVVCESQPK